jgi:hypothetical protein
MSKFTFTRAGEIFEVIAPPGTTEAAARAVFEQQAKTGALTNLAPGQSVNALNQLQQGLVSAASQLKGAVSSVVGGAQKVVSQLVGGQVPKTMNVADFVNVGGQVGSIGPLNGKQVQGLLAQSAASVSQAAGAFSVDKGIGKFGINPALLESSGFLKPGTISQYGRANTVSQADIAEATRINSQGGSITPEQVAQSRALQQALASPTVWTGKGGVTNLNTMLADPAKQLAAQTDIMNNQFSALTKSGALPVDLPVAEAGALIQAAGKAGAALTAVWAKGGSPAGLTQNISNLAKSGQLAVNFTDLKVPNNLAGERSAPKATNTVNRQVLNQAFTQFIGNEKVPVVEYGQDQPESATQSRAPSAAATPAPRPRSPEAAILEGQIEGKENGQRSRREQLARAEAQGDASAIAYWQQKIAEADREIAQLRAQLARLG